MEYVYEWVETIACYLVLVTVGMQMIPGESYKKYIRFFAGMILILLLTEPAMRMFGMQDFWKEEYQKELEEIKDATRVMEEKSMGDSVAGRDSPGSDSDSDHIRAFR